MLPKFRTDPSVFAVLLIISSTAAWRNFDMFFTDIKCSYNPNYLVNSTCSLDPGPHSGINVEGFLVKEITDLRMEFVVDIDRSNNEHMNLLTITNRDACKLLSDNITQPLLKIYKEVIKKAGSLPSGCPIPVGYHYMYKNVTLNAEYLPPYVPESTFKVQVGLKEKFVGIWNITTTGEVRYKKRKKGLFN